MLKNHFCNIFGMTLLISAVVLGFSGTAAAQQKQPAITGASISGDQELLKRRAFLGVGGEATRAASGLRLTYVDEAATAGVAGLRPGDVLLSVNDKPVAGMDALVAAAGTVRAGDEVTFEIERAGTALTLSARATPRARETSDEFVVEYTQVKIKDGLSRVMIYRPEGSGRYPALFYLQGFNCASIDFGGRADDPIRRFAQDVVRAGYVVVRQEKHGVGDSLSAQPCDEVDFDTEVAAFAKGYEMIAQLPYVDPAAVFLFGHSLGGATAPALTKAHDPLGIITYGAPSRPWGDYLIDVLELQPAILGVSPRRAKERVRIGTPYVHDLMNQDLSWEEIAMRNPEAVREGIFRTQDEKVFNRDFRFLRTLGAFDIEQAWRAYDGNILAVFGTYDVHVISDTDARHLVSLVNDQGTGQAKLLILNNAEHGLSKFDGSREAYVEQLVKGGWTQSVALAAYDPRIAAETVNWMNEVRLIKTDE